MRDVRARKIFLAGATGAIGRTLRALPEAADAPLILHFRPARRAEAADHQNARVLDLDDATALADAMATCTTVIQLIGTMRKRFSTGDTYESSDIGTTEHLVRAAKVSGVDHIVLLSSVGAGRPVGAYLQAKATAEKIVRDSGIAFTIFRPSAFAGEGHAPPPGMGLLTKALKLARYRPIAVQDLARAILHVATDRRHLGEVLEGDALWAAVDEANGA